MSVCYFDWEEGYVVDETGYNCIKGEKAIAVEWALNATLKAAAASSHISSTVMTGMQVVKGLAVLNFGPGVWVFINTLQISRVVPLISPHLNKELSAFLYSDLSIYGVNLNFGDLIANAMFKSIENPIY